MRPPVDHIARLDQQRSAAGPGVTIVYEPGVTEYLRESIELAMDVSD